MQERITPYRRSLGWLRTDTRRTYFAAILMYRIHRFKPSNLITWQIFSDDTMHCSSEVPRERKDWAIRGTNTGLSSFQIKGAHLWNSSSVRDFPSISSFKRQVYEYLLLSSTHSSNLELSCSTRQMTNDKR